MRVQQWASAIDGERVDELASGIGHHHAWTNPWAERQGQAPSTRSSVTRATARRSQRGSPTPPPPRAGRRSPPKGGASGSYDDWPVVETAQACRGNRHRGQVDDEEGRARRRPAEPLMSRGGAPLVTIRIGTSGWSYDHWDGVLYPHGLPASERLAVRPRVRHRRAQRELLPLAARRDVRRLAAPAAGRLRHVRQGAARPDARQAPVRARGVGRSGSWLAGTSSATGAGSCWCSFARTRSATTRGWTISSGSLPAGAGRRRASPPVLADRRRVRLLERHGAAYCVMSGAHLPCVLRATAPFVYVRMHGPDHDHLYGGSYSDDDLRWWADRIREWPTTVVTSRLLQQRRRRQRRPQWSDPAVDSRRVRRGPGRKTSSDATARPRISRGGASARSARVVTPP